MNRIIKSQLLLALFIPCCSLTAFASEVFTEGETSQRDVQYQEFSISREEMEQGRTEQCTVTVSQPYSYSVDIPKAPGPNNPDKAENNGHKVIINTDNNKLVDIQDEGVPKSNKPVQTGDNTPIALYSAIAALGVAGMVGLKAKSRKNNN